MAVAVRNASLHRGGVPKPADARGRNEELRHRSLTEMADHQFVLALLRYGATHGLPKISPAECRARLEAM